MELKKGYHLCYQDVDGLWYHSLSCPNLSRGLGSFGATGLLYAIKPESEIMRENFERELSPPYSYTYKGNWMEPDKLWGSWGLVPELLRGQSLL